MVHSMIMNEKSYFGYGSREKLITEIQNNDFRNILLVTDESLVKEQIANLVTELLDKNNIIYTIYDQVKPNPTITIIKDGIKLAKEKNIDLIVAVGGGSSIDTAKAIGLVLTNPEYEDIVSLEGKKNAKNRAIPIIALPTTTGTGSEATIMFLINDEQKSKKMICVDSNSIPTITIIDPDLSKNMPKNIAAETGIEALTQAIEGYMNKEAWQISDIYNINAMSMIYKNIEKAVNNKDLKAIEFMSYAEYLTGINTSLGLVQIMSYAIGAYFDISNGLANAILLPVVLKYYGQKQSTLFKNIAPIFEIEKELTNIEIINGIIKKKVELKVRLNLPKTLKEINIPKEMIPTLAKQAFDNVCTIGNNIDATVDDIKAIYQEVYE